MVGAAWYRCRKSPEGRVLKAGRRHQTTEIYLYQSSNKEVPFSNKGKDKAMKIEGGEWPFIFCAKDTVGLAPTARSAIRLWETFTFKLTFYLANEYGTREGTCEFYFLTCSDDLICCSNDLISCLHNLSSCSNDIIKLL